MATGEARLVMALLGPPNRPSHVSPTLDEAFAALEDYIPGFAGLYYDQDGTPVVRLAWADSESPARRILRPLLDSNASTSRGAARRLSAEPRFLSAAYGFRTLKSWYDQLRDPFGIRAVVYTDIDEITNRITIGFSDSAAIPSITSMLRSSGVPDDAFALVLSGQIHPTSLSVTDRVRPLKGGILMHAQNRGPCTLGFWTRLATGLEGYIVNSHCGLTAASLDNNWPFFQNFSNSNNRFGMEVLDPPYFICKINKHCRYSDAAFVLLDDTVARHRGYISRTLYAEGNSPGSLSFHVNDDSTRFEIISKAGPFDVLSGQDVQKVGATSGWTYGRVVNTCMDVDNDYIGHLLCQQKSEAFQDFGDSGAPVFKYTYCAHDPTRCVMLAGIAWGKEEAFWSGKVYVLYSMVSQVERDFPSHSPMSVVAQ